MEIKDKDGKVIDRAFSLTKDGEEILDKLGYNEKTEFSKYHKIKILGNEDNEGIFSDGEDEIIIEEKVDGGNFRFMLRDGVLIFGTRTQQITSNEGEESNVPKNFKNCLIYVRDKVVTGEISGSYIFYGECMIPHSMQYDWERIPPYLGFDIKDLTTGQYLGYDEKVALFRLLNLPIVPLVKRIKAFEMTELNDDSVPDTKYPAPSAKDLQAEGICIKNYKKQLFAKYVRDAFREKNKEAFGDSKKWARQDSDEALLVATYCLNARIDKMIFKLIDEDQKLDMPMMAELPRRVIQDIWEEHWKEILNSNWTLDLKGVRKKINKRCLAVLKQAIVNNALLKKDKNEI